MEILGVNIENWSREQILKEIENSSLHKKNLLLTYANVFVVLKTYQDKIFSTLLKNNFKVHSDGIGVYLARMILSNKKSFERINGSDLYFEILKLAEKKEITVSFYGGSDDAISLLFEKIKAMFPKLVCVCAISREKKDDQEIINQLNHNKSDILFVGLGTPRQEEWIVQNNDCLNIPVKIAVGSGIDYLAETYKRAPKIFRKAGLEWFFRLLHDPKRLWKRYIIGNPHFIFLIIREYFRAEKRNG